MITVAFFNNRRGVGQTSLVYHVAWALTELGRRVLVADLDPQAGLSARCLREERLEELWSAEGPRRQTVFGAVHDLGRTLGEPAPVPAEPLSNRLGLLVGDLALSTFEATLSDAWQRRHDRSAPSHRLTGALDRAVRQAALDWGADVALIDLGPNLSAINRAAVVTAEWLVTPLNADLFSVQALRSLGPALKTWRSEWAARVDRGALSPGA
ncbi:MAG TPA: ParA family protein, partial [Polyangiaceae bacterium]|nr:ParA family protein [Polyangiaceae bacterium]